MKTTQTLPQVKDCGASEKCDSFDLFAELRKKPDNIGLFT